MKNLIYFTVGGMSDYIVLTQLCISSILNTNPDKKFDIMIMCDEKYKNNIDIDDVDIMIVNDNKDHIQASMRKVEIFSYSKIWEYENVLYLDSDIIINGNLNVLFDRIKEADKLYVKRETDISINNSHYWWTKELNEDDIKRINNDDMNFFNCGQFLFKVSKTMESHFSNILHNININKKTFFYEQTFMNEYFLETSNIIIDPIIQSNITINGVNTYNDILKGIIKYDSNEHMIIHFANTCVQYQIKYEYMLSLLNYLKNIKSFNTRDEMIKHYIQENFKIAQIGVFRGVFSTILLNTKPYRLDLIDLWEGIITKGDQDGNNVLYGPGLVAMAEVENKFQNYNNVFIQNCDSVTFLNKVEDDSYDMIYLDSDYSYLGIKRDIELAFKKIKKGGYIMGNVYEINFLKKKYNHKYDFGVKRAVDEFCVTYNQKILAKTLDGYVSFCIKKD